MCMQACAYAFSCVCGITCVWVGAHLRANICGGLKLISGTFPNPDDSSTLLFEAGSPNQTQSSMTLSGQLATGILRLYLSRLELWASVLAWHLYRS